MKIYTKTGDTGKTALIGGMRVLKADPRIEAYGTIDELIAFTGLLRDGLVNPDIKSILLKVQDRLMVIASLLAAQDEASARALPQLKEQDVVVLEKEIDRMEEHLEPLRSFVIPGGHPLVSHCHICRTICRRAERRVIILPGTLSSFALIIKYLNRLSDFLFVLSRLISKELQVEEIPWKPDL